MHHNPKYTLLAAISLGLSLLASGGWAADMIDVRLGYSELVRTDQPAETVIVGNDQVANATIAAESTIVVTGNALGSTNLILLDETGAEISSSVVRVVPVDPRPQQTVRLISGGAGESATVYHCGPEPGCTAAGEGAASVAATPVLPTGDDGEESPEETP